MPLLTSLDSDVCLSRRLVRDINERGRHLEGILKQYFAFVKPANENYVHKQAHIADIVIPHGPLNIKAIGHPNTRPPTSEHVILIARHDGKTHIDQLGGKISPTHA
jgi:uridine kinase